MRILIWALDSRFTLQSKAPVPLWSFVQRHGRHMPFGAPQNKYAWAIDKCLELWYNVDNDLVWSGRTLIIEYGGVIMRWGDRRSDFGRSDLAPPTGMRMIPVDMPNGEVWRFELEPGEDDTPELRAELANAIAKGIIPIDTLLKTAHHANEQ